MNATWKRGTAWVLGIILIAAVVALTLLNVPARGNNAQVDKGGNARYSVIHTEGTNLLVTDNQNNTLYFFTIEEDGKPGDDLILRGTLDLSQVGKGTIKPTLVNPRKKPN